MFKYRFNERKWKIINDTKKNERNMDDRESMREFNINILVAGGSYDSW